MMDRADVKVTLPFRSKTIHELNIFNIFFELLVYHKHRMPVRTVPSTQITTYREGTQIIYEVVLTFILIHRPWAILQ